MFYIFGIIGFMNIGIVGFGKMGKRIYDLAHESSYCVKAVIDSFSDDSRVTSKSIDKSSLLDVDVVIDFSAPVTAIENIKKYVDLSIPAVIGTTGWYDKLDEVNSYVNENNGSILYSGNFSLGVAALLKIVSYASKLMNALPSYDVAVHEVHHNKKADSPSGTGLMVAEEIVKNLDRKDKIDCECQHEKIEPNVLHLSSSRVGSIPGIHEVIFDSDVDTITISHSARSRDGFASGALRAAKWLIAEKRAGLFSMDDLINNIFGE